MHKADTEEADDSLKLSPELGSKARVRGLEGIVRVKLEAETGLEEKPHKKSKLPLLTSFLIQFEPLFTDFSAILCNPNKRGRRADERSDKTSALRCRLLVKI